MPNQPLWSYQGESETRLDTNQTMPLKQDWKPTKLCLWNKTGNQPNYASETRLETKQTMPLKQDWKQNKLCLWNTETRLEKHDWKQNYTSEARPETKKTTPLKQEDWKQNKLYLSKKTGNKQKYASETREETKRLEIN